jgi:aminopeptidase YwaD
VVVYDGAVKKSTTALVLGAFLLEGSVPLRAQRARDVITEASVRGHLEFLASDALNGRGSGTRDEWIAAAYIAGQLRRWGIEPLGDNGGYVQQVDMEVSEAAAPPILMYEGSRLSHGKEMIVQSLGAARTSGPLQKFQPGVPARPGAVLVMPDPVPGSSGAAIAGASAVIIAETTQTRGRWESLGSRLPALAARVKGVASSARPSSIVLDKASYAAISALADGTTITLAAEVKPPQLTHTWNAIGKITGRDKTRASEVVLLSAHLDHLGNRPSRDGASPSDTIYNGADDDASGSVAVLELAEALAKERRPKRTIVFTWFGSEESGGYGARFFLEHPPVPLETIVANLEFEMIGRPDAAVAPHTLWLTGYERSDLGPRLAKQGARIVQDPHPEQSFFTRSDNIQLARRGVVAQTVSSFGLHKDYHQPSDEVRLVDFPHMTESIQSMLAPLRWLASSTFKPAWKPGMKP